MNLALEKRLSRWKAQGAISADQHQALTALAAQTPFSVFVELNALVYIGVLSFIGGLGWTLQRHAMNSGGGASGDF